MSGGTLPRTGATVVGLAVPGTAYVVHAPLPLLLLAVGVTLVVAGVVLVRLTWRRRRPVGVS